MSGKLIRCLCGEMFDPAQHDSCPTCGRPAVPPTPARNPAPPAPPPAARAPQATAPPASAGGSPALPGWVWKAAAGVAVLSVLVFAATRFTTDDDAAGPRPADAGMSRISTDMRERAAPDSRCARIAGDWTWFTGGFVHFAADGKAFFKPTEDAPPAITANWTCDPADGSFSVAWAHGFTDVLRLYDDDQVLQGTNHTGVEVSGKRHVDPARGMPPPQTVSAGSQQVPRNLPELAEAAYGVADDWRPDAFLVALRIRKDGWPNKDAFYVELSFYSPSEGTGLWISSHLTKTRVREAGTVNWGTDRLPDRFVDFPEALQSARKAGMRGLVSRAELRVDSARGGTPVWRVTPELHGQAVAPIDATSGKVLSRR